MKSVTDEIRELAAMPVAELALRYEALFGCPPRVKHRVYLWRRCAWKIQELRFGGLSGAAKRRLDELIAGIELPSAAVSRDRDPRLPQPGTTIVREWRGREIRVGVTADGFEYLGAQYRSLTAVAKAVTGTHWNGRVFFGLSSRNRT